MPVASPLSAQETRGQIIGRVTDATGAVLVGAQVKAVNSETNVATAAATNHTGDYTLPFLIPGTYNVFVEMAGFRGFEQTGIRVQVDDKVAINVTLQLGAASESIQVVADSPLIDAADGTLSSVVDSRNATELPLKDGNPMMLVDLSPGVVNLSENGATRPFDNNNSSAMAISGSRSGTNEYRIDGAPNTTGGAGTVAYMPPAGVVSEVKVQSNPFDATSGFSTGATVNVSLKSGNQSPTWADVLLSSEPHVQRQRVLLEPRRAAER